MKTQTHQVVRRSLKAPSIYQSEHEPFLPGNIAKRGVIGMISRKAISPLDRLVTMRCYSGVNQSPLSSKPFFFPFRQAPDISSGPARVPLILRKTGYLYDRESFLFLIRHFIHCH